MTMSSPHDGVPTARRLSNATLPVIVDTTVEMISSPAPLLPTKSEGKELPAEEAPKVASYSRSTYAAFICFGLCSWVMTNTTFVEMSHFMLHLPEKLSVVSYAMFALQTADNYPIIFTSFSIPSTSY
ncbi:hypothetical protein Poli38472_007039 [Pythium oligandrum]|uniref:Uncharacterized protein n=1 Tax=Pythium oligandrum TaxID=41045 RepID=A0A8K1C9E7_PYTOL|nr:hypothetical protein Poli38472_007039 [Pythium oligandrum]|eukprot:TMW58894.1 hypothetical protein Poli38472_007039 [Pythium oligandrum]